MPNKCIGEVKISDPASVKSKCSGEGGTYQDGAVYCNVPELGLVGEHMIYCRYGLSVPYMRVKTGWKVLVEPTIGYKERWFYTGIVDCGDSDTAPSTSDQIIIPLEAGKLTLELGDTVKITIDGSAKTAKVELESNVSIEVDGSAKTVDIKSGSDAKIEMDGSGKTVTITSGQSKIEMSDSSVKVNGTGLEVSSS
jgi:hypothetical protein